MAGLRVARISGVRALRLATDIPYRFLPGDIGGEDLTTIAAAQLSRLSLLLADPADAAAGHHKARKCIKRLRALLRLARAAAGDKPWRQVDRALRDLGRSVSGARDATAQLLMLDRLQTDHGRVALGAGGQALRDALLSSSQAAPQVPDTAVLSGGVARAAKMVHLLPLASFDAASALRGVQAAYRSARHAVPIAYASADAEDFHRLRKCVQQHWRHMQLFVAAWPDEQQARIELARTLSERLGEDHDLWLLRLQLRQDKTRTRELDHLCSDRQVAIRSEVHPLLRLLLAERPKALRQRLEALWAAVPACLPSVGAPDDGRAGMAHHETNRQPTSRRQ